MHTNQFMDFADLDPRATNPGLLSAAPWVMEGMTYATDRRCCIRMPGEAKGFEKISPTDPDEKRRKFVGVALNAFAFFADVSNYSKTALSTLNLEPVLVRRMVVPAPLDFENPGMNEPEEKYQAACSPVQIGKRWLDAKRLLFIRQTLPNVAFYEQPAADYTVPLHFVFGEQHEGQGALMCMKQQGREPMLHWNGARYYPHW